MRTIIGGQVIGRYRIEAMLAQGGVYKAEDNQGLTGREGRRVALEDS